MGYEKRIIEREIRRAIAPSKRQKKTKRIMYTKFLLDRGYTDPAFFAHFWGISESTARAYIREAKYASVPDSEIKKIEEIARKKGCSLPDAVAIRYHSACFIATASYGTPLHRDIEILRNWRDTVLMPTYAGRFFVNFYYCVSPLIAHIIEKSETLKLLTRKMIKIMSRRCNCL